ncbi:WD40 repeat domain-containing protein [Crocosphaera sp. XPORK-15E]|uniref:WD40 repeat domain-containing protein n=1 Tax=Crocosphaera sp. XPORK-15E TaxID=3110247 RepID=UPI002B1F6034|nr:WD40 repeat domain-containing protein [Crocosphaera sp. XPORK-15E]MEA5534840.1 WD40 repeat domain-containing protein [Crocosphaera sp. XPORK-15E]
MNAKQFHWLEIAEFVALGAAVISLFGAIAVDNFLFPLIFVTLALILNSLNRLRSQYLNRKGLASTKKQLQHLFQQIEELITTIPQPTPTPPPTTARDTDSRAIARLKDNLISIEQSLNGVVQYLNSQGLPERIEQLEKYYGRLTQEMRDLITQLEIPPKETQPTPNRSDFGDLAQSNTDSVVEPVETVVEPVETDGESPEPPPQPAASLDFLQSSTKLPIVAPTREVSPAPIIPEWHCLYTLTEHSDAVASLSLSSDGKWLASGSWDQTLRIWDLNEGTLKSQVTAHSQGLLAVVFIGDDGNRYHIATGSFDQTIKLWLFDQEAFTLDLDTTLTQHTGSVHSLALSAQPLLLVSGSYDQTVKQWELPRGQMHCSSYDPLGAIYALAVYAPQSLIVSAGGDGRVTLWQLENGEQIGFLAGNVSSVESLAISKDGQTLAAGCVDGSIKIWQLDPSRFGAGRPLQPVRVLNAHTGQVKALLFSEQEQILFSGGADGYLKIWHPSRREAIAALTMGDPYQPRHTAILSLAFDEQRQLLVAGSADGMMKIWQQISD